MTNLAHYRDHGAELALTFCLMRENWHEFADYLRLADDWDAPVHVNTVIDPGHSLFRLPADELAPVIEALERQAPVLGRNQGVWDEELDRLRTWQQRAAGTPVDVPTRWFQDQEVAPVPRALRTGSSPVVADELAWVHVEEGLAAPERARLHCDAADVVRAVEGRHGFVGLAAERCVGQPFEEVARRLAEVNGDRVRTLRDEVVDGGARRQVVYRDRSGTATYVQVFAWPKGDGGRYAGSTMVAAWSSEIPTWAPGPAA
jgi:hypothetical protein